MRAFATISLLVSLGLVGCSEDSDPVNATPADAGADVKADVASDTPAAAAKVIAPTAMIDGKTYPQRSAMWWQWALAIPAAKNPMAGLPCAEAQTGNVFYLAGTADGKPATRSCTIPAGKSLFYPLVNAVCYPCHEDEGCTTPHTDAELKGCMTLPTMKTLESSVDGVPITGLDKHNFTSEVFSFKAPTSDPVFSCIGPIATNTCGIPTGDRFGVSFGYWVGLEPLAKGKHTLKFKAVVPGAPGADGGPPADDFVQDVTYDLTVE